MWQFFGAILDPAAARMQRRDLPRASAGRGWHSPQRLREKELIPAPRDHLATLPGNLPQCHCRVTLPRYRRSRCGGMAVVKRHAIGTPDRHPKGALTHFRCRHMLYLVGIALGDACHGLFELSGIVAGGFGNRRCGGRARSRRDHRSVSYHGWNLPRLWATIRSAAQPLRATAGDLQKPGSFSGFVIRSAGVCAGGRRCAVKRGFSTLTSG